jgi:polysaccharide export outer membrane protein
MKKKLPLCYFLVTCAVFCLLSSGTALPGMPSPQTKAYTIGPGDRLTIQVWDHDDLNRTVEVAPDGTFSFPFIGKVQASDKTAFMIENTLVEKLSDGYLVGPQVTVGVIEYNNKKVFLFGEVVRPGSYVLRSNMRLLELISGAGGFTASRGSTCTVVRSSNADADAKPIAIEDATGHEIITVNLTQLTKGNPGENIRIAPNDSIYISAAERIFVTGEVKRPGEIEYREGMTVRQAISLAGGGTPKAAVGRIRIVRMDNGKETEIKPSPGDPIFPNDILKVPESFF